MCFIGVPGVSIDVSLDGSFKEKSGPKKGKEKKEFIPPKIVVVKIPEMINESPNFTY